MKKRKHKFKYLREFIRTHKIKDSSMKRGIYAALFNMPKKMKKALKGAKNKNHKQYMICTFEKIAKKANSQDILSFLSQV